MSFLIAQLNLFVCFPRCGFRLPGWRVRDIVDRMDRGHEGLSIEEFESICVDLKSKEISSTFKKAVSRRENLQTLGGMSEASSEGTTHSVRHEEQVLIRSKTIIVDNY